MVRDAGRITKVPGVFTADDTQRGQSLIVRPIAEGRSAPRAIDQYLMGESQLPAPLHQERRPVCGLPAVVLGMTEDGSRETVD